MALVDSVPHKASARLKVLQHESDALGLVGVSGRHEAVGYRGDDAAGAAGAGRAAAPDKK